MIEAARVARWLGQPVVIERAAGTGSSNVTLFVRVGDVDAVLQHPPLVETLPTAHDLSRQHRFVQAVAGTAVPVPRVLAFCADATVAGVPFMITERCGGTCLLGDAAAIIDAPALALHAVDVLVDLHALDPSDRAVTARPGSYLERQILRWREQLAHTPTAPRLGDLSPLYDWLLEERPRHEDRAIVHGDYGFHNLLVGYDRVLAVLDWELATVGDPLVDLIGLVKSWGEGALSPNPANDVVANAPGGLDREALIDRYEARSGRSFRASRAYYEAFSLWKSIGIFEGVHARSGGTRFGDDVPILVARLRAMTGDRRRTNGAE